MIGFAILAILIYRSKYGAVLRGFGNNETAMINSGWSRVKAYMSIYAIAGFFAFMAGVICYAINNASDASASGTYTMVAVASVIIGGGYFSGGIRNEDDLEKVMWKNANRIFKLGLEAE